MKKEKVKIKKSKRKNKQTKRKYIIRTKEYQIAVLLS